MNNRLLIGAFALTLTATLPSTTLAQDFYADFAVSRNEAEVHSFDTKDTSFRVGGGYWLADNISAEAGFWDLGSDRDRGVKVSADGFYGAVRAQADINDTTHLYGRLGLLRWDADIGSDDDDGHDLFIGAGVGVNAGPGIASFEIHFMELDEIDITTVGLSYRLPLDF